MYLRFVFMRSGNRPYHIESDRGDTRIFFQTHVWINAAPNFHQGHVNRPHEIDALCFILALISHAASPVKLAKSFAVITPFVSELILRIKSKEQSCPLMMRERVAAVVPTRLAKPRRLSPSRSRYFLSGCLLIPVVTTSVTTVQEENVTPRVIMLFSKCSIMQA